MKYSGSLFFATLLLPLLAFSQNSVKVNILDMYNQIPAPARTVQDAVSRAECTSNGDMTSCNTNAYYKSATMKLDELGQKIQKAVAELSQPKADMAAQVDPQEMEKKMATMNQSEKIEFAMAMAQKMGYGAKALAPESEAVQEAEEEYRNIAAQLANDIQNVTEIAKKRGKSAEERDRKHREVGEWESKEIGKLPYIDFTEAGKFKDSKKVYAIQMQAMDRHLRIEDEYLTSLQKQFADLLLEKKSRFGNFQKKLAAVRYGDDAKNVETKNNLLGGQQLMAGGIDELLNVSQQATDDAVNWWIQKQRLEKNKPF